MFKVLLTPENCVDDEMEFECDLIDHDGTGDIRLYKYDTEDMNPLAKVKLVYKFEAHIQQIVSVGWERK